MLMLTRGVRQRIIIGDDIVVEVVQIDRGRVRLGFIAPLGISIHREEVYLKIQDKNNEKDQQQGGVSTTPPRGNNSGSG